MTKFQSQVASFLRDDEGAQVVEYALIIALASIGLALALKLLIPAVSTSGFIKRVSDCLTGGTCTA